MDPVGNRKTFFEKNIFVYFGMFTTYIGSDVYDSASLNAHSALHPVLKKSVASRKVSLVKTSLFGLVLAP